MFNVQLTMKSSNVKTGPIPVSTTGAQSCPNACSLKGSGCYAEGGPLGMHWRKVITCPATYRDDVSCATCQMCQHGGNRAIIGFPVHGASKRKAGKVFMMKSA